MIAQLVMLQTFHISVLYTDLLNILIRSSPTRSRKKSVLYTNLPGSRILLPVKTQQYSMHTQVYPQVFIHEDLK